jgi:hypothetical protein
MLYASVVVKSASRQYIQAEGHTQADIATIHNTYEQGWPEPYICTLYMTAYLVISLPKIPNMHRIQACALTP